MAGPGAPSAWPRVRHPWWVLALALGALALFTVGFALRLRCAQVHCTPSPVERLLDLDALGGLPRLFTTGLFAAVAWLALRARSWSTGRPRLWWTAAGVVALLLALAKLTSAHSAAKNGTGPGLTLVAGLTLTCVVLAVLWSTGRRWGVGAARPVVLALAFYAATSLGLDLVTGLAAAVQTHVGSLTEAAATFVEELGEALAALLLLVVVRWQAIRPSDDARREAQSVRQQ